MHPEQVRSGLKIEYDLQIPEVVRFDPDGYLTTIDVPLESPKTHLIGMITTKDCY